MKAEDVENRPPLTWFTGMGRKDKGISNVTANENFTSLGNGEVASHWSEWAHYTGNPITPGDPEERVQRATKALSEAENFIIKATGYHPREIMEEAHRLSHQYRGKIQAPFTVELY